MFQNVSILAGVRFDKAGEPIPVGIGRLCHWTHTGDTDADDFDSFGAYQRTLQLKCDVGDPGIVTWTPDRSTPDVVYYQVINKPEKETICSKVAACLVLFMGNIHR